jgi:hypothetical protein
MLAVAGALGPDAEFVIHFPPAPRIGLGVGVDAFTIKRITG